MKKLLFTLALSVQVAFAMATDNKKIMAQARQENVKMYLQPGTSTPVLQDLSIMDRLEVVRRYNSTWTIVMVNGQAGYVLHSEITKPATHKTLAAAKVKR